MSPSHTRIHAHTNSYRVHIVYICSEIEIPLEVELHGSLTCAKPWTDQALAQEDMLMAQKASQGSLQAGACIPRYE